MRIGSSRATKASVASAWPKRDLSASWLGKSKDRSDIASVRDQVPMLPKLAPRQLFFEGLRDAMLEGLDCIRKEERWLYRNKEALESVVIGLEQASRGEFAEPPDLE